MFYNNNIGIDALISEPYPNKDRGILNTSLRSYDLPVLIEKMRKSRTWAQGELNAMILLKSPDKQIVLTALHEGTEISSFQSTDSITFQIIEGKLKFHSKRRTLTLDKGQLHTLRENIKYNLTAKDETVLLITIASETLRHAAI
jgi:quercetin dioxygenase-like cupin family protein